MSVCWNAQALRQNCNPDGYSGGIARIWIFDPHDWDFTQATSSPVALATPYTAIAQSPPAVAAGNPTYLYQVAFKPKTAEYTFSQEKGENCGKYEHQIELFAQQLSHTLTNFNASLDSAGCCLCGIGLVVQHTDGKIFVHGEYYVNGAILTYPLDGYYQDGSSGSTGKLIDDANGETIILKATHNRKFYELEGVSLADLIALQP